VASLGGPSSASALLELREVLAAAREQAARRRAAWDVDRDAAYGASALDLAALAPVVSGELPLVVGADRASDLWSLLGFAAEQRVRLVISGGAEAWQLADVLAERGVPVIIDPLLVGPASFDQVGARADNARILAEAGVPVILSTFSTHHARTLAQVAGNAARAGMEPEAALAAITATPAAVFGAPDRGRLAVGALADIVLWSGPPLSLSSAPDAVWVEGRATSMVTRQTRLRDRYRNLPGTPRAPLSTP
jgi:imidazolonepropionase-like amidohydrolase